MVFMDEEDNTLYTCSPYPGDNENEEPHKIFIHNNIVFKLCSPHDMVYTNCFDSSGGGLDDGRSTFH